jgi:gas vesicle protein
MTKSIKIPFTKIVFRINSLTQRDYSNKQIFKALFQIERNPIIALNISIIAIFRGFYLSLCFDKYTGEQTDNKITPKIEDSFNKVKTVIDNFEDDLKETKEKAKGKVKKIGKNVKDMEEKLDNIFGKVEEVIKKKRGRPPKNG